jgi:lipoic acid synthetase
MNLAPQPKRQFPPWLKKPWPAQSDSRTREVLQELKLNSVCQAAECPNLGECWARGTATFMILGRICTRACKFCAVESGAGESLAALADEPERVAEAVQKLGLKHAVITSVTRDDLADEGAGHFARTIAALRRKCGPQLVIEVLVPDFHAREDCLRAVLEAGPGVFNHNIETVERLYSQVRPQADYHRSLRVLAAAKRLAPQVPVKSGLMAGLGETEEEVGAALRDLRASGCELLTIGQYLQPSKTHLPVSEHVRPEVFKRFEQYALKLGFKAVASGPFVRSSYQAEKMLIFVSAFPVPRGK